MMEEDIFENTNQDLETQIEQIKDSQGRIDEVKSFVLDSNKHLGICVRRNDLYSVFVVVGEDKNILAAWAEPDVSVRNKIYRAEWVHFRLKRLESSVFEPNIRHLVFDVSRIKPKRTIVPLGETLQVEARISGLSSKKGDFRISTDFVLGKVRVPEDKYLVDLLKKGYEMRVSVALRERDDQTFYNWIVVAVQDGTAYPVDENEMDIDCNNTLPTKMPLGYRMTQDLPYDLDEVTSDCYKEAPLNPPRMTRLEKQLSEEELLGHKECNPKYIAQYQPEEHCKKYRLAGLIVHYTDHCVLMYNYEMGICLIRRAKIEPKEWEICSRLGQWISALFTKPLLRGMDGKDIYHLHEWICIGEVMPLNPTFVSLPKTRVVRLKSSATNYEDFVQLKVGVKCTRRNQNKGFAERATSTLRQDLTLPMGHPFFADMDKKDGDSYWCWATFIFDSLNWKIDPDLCMLTETRQQVISESEHMIVVKRLNS